MNLASRSLARTFGVSFVSAALLAGCATSQTIGGLPAGTYESLSDDATVSQIAGEAELLVSLPRFDKLRERLGRAEHVVELKEPIEMRRGNLGVLPRRSRLGFADHGHLAWVVLGGKATVMQHQLPKGSIVTLKVDEETGRETLKSVVLGAPTQYGRNRFLAGDEITEWPEGQATPTLVTLNDRHTFFGKRYDDAMKIEFDSRGQVLGVDGED